LKRIDFLRDPDGSVHAINANHPDVTEDDIRQVLVNMAWVRANHPRYPGQKLATGACSGAYNPLTVAYLENAARLFVLTCWPAAYYEVAEYRRRVLQKGRGALWLPVDPTV
jgi:hypothetical protein